MSDVYSLTIPEQTMTCNKCGDEFDTRYNWENGWPNYGSITLGCAAQSFGKLGGSGASVASKEQWEWWGKNRESPTPPFIKVDAQEVVLEWGSRTDGPYRMCHGCQSDFIGVIGKFFGVPQQESKGE